MLTLHKAPQCFAIVIAAIIFSLLGVSSASATSVAYLDGHEVWVANVDGSARAQLSSGEGDWTAVAQSDQGYIVGVRLEANKIAQLSTFTVWDPSGNRIYFGPLAGNANGSMAYPLSLDITPDGKLLIYGFSQYIYGYPVGTLITGHYLLPSTTTSAPVPEPYKNTNALWPTLFGDRVVGTPDQHQTWVQDASSIGSTTFNGWIDFTGVTGFNLHRTDVAATGNVIAAELDQFGPPEIMKIAMVPVSIQNLTLGAGDCFLNTDALPRYPSLSQDGTLIAWSDAGGVKVGGVPDFSGADPCVLTKPAITISPTGSYPSVGPFNVAAISKTPAPVAPPTLTAPKTQKLKDFAKTGLLLKIGFAAGGKATANVTVLPKTIGKKGKKAIVIASGSVTLPAGGALKILKLKLNSKGKSLAKKLKGKKVTITVTVGGSTTTQSLKLK